MGTAVASPAAVRKFHASLNVSNLDRAVAFYRVLLGVEAAKKRIDYAKFEMEDPPLVLSLVPRKTAGGGALNHVGLRVSTSEDLVAIQKRVEEAGIATKREDGVECCYALQTKFWVNDPDNTMWEVYVFHNDLEDHGSGSVPLMAAETPFAKDVPRARAQWEHRIPDPVPARIPHDDNSLDEVHLQGTANAKAGFEALVRDAFRALRPAGTIHVHGLAGDSALPADLELALPGPASVVERVPIEAEPAKILAAAGFAGVQFEKLSKSAYFTISGVRMREAQYVAAKPGYRPKTQQHQAVYLGPLAEVTDDFQNRFPRGERVALNIHDWQLLSKGPVSSHFQFFTPEETAPADTAKDSCCSKA